VHGRERIVFYQRFPGSVELALVRQREPRLDVLSRRTRAVAGGQQVHVNRPAGTKGPGTLLAGQIDQWCDVSPLVWHLMASMLEAWRNASNRICPHCSASPFSVVKLFSPPASAPTLMQINLRKSSLAAANYGKLL
jgi:hypothetical protein